MKNNRLDNKGITLLELIITLSIMTIILQIIYSVFCVGNQSFNMSKDQGLLQKDLRIVSDYIINEIRNGKEISPEAFSSKTIYYSLSLEKKDKHNTLCRTKYTPNKESEKLYIGESITELLFLPSEKDEMIQVKIKGEERARTYELDFELLLENIETLNIDKEGIDKIFYTKYK